MGNCPELTEYSYDFLHSENFYWCSFTKTRLCVLDLDHDDCFDCKYCVFVTGKTPRTTAFFTHLFLLGTRGDDYVLCAEICEEVVTSFQKNVFCFLTLLAFKKKHLWTISISVLFFLEIISEYYSIPRLG